MPHLWILFLSLIFIGCSSSEELTREFKGSAMTMRYKVIVGKPLTYTESQRVKKIIHDIFEKVDQIYNKWNSQSEISRLNRLSGNTRVFISSGLEQFLSQVGTIVDLSSGRFDPTMEPAQKLWKEKLNEGRIPDETEIMSLSKVIGWDKIHVESGFFWKDHTECALDLGGIAKGYAVDLICEKLMQEGCPNVFVEWGGDVRAVGKHPAGRPWNIYISRFDDTDPENALAFITLEDQAVATSGDYLQNWTVKCDESTNQWRTYFHIFDSVKCTPLVAKHDSIASVTVCAPTCALADALATTAMTFSNTKEAETWAKEIQKNDPSITFFIFSRKSISEEDAR